IIGGSSQLIVDIIEQTSQNYNHTLIVPEIPEPLPYQPLNIKKFSLHELPALYNYLKIVQPGLVHIHYWVRDIHYFEGFSIWYRSVYSICENLNIKIIQNVNVPTHPHSSPNVVHNVFVSKYVQNEY